MIATREQMKTEAIERLKIIGVRVKDPADYNSSMMDISDYDGKLIEPSPEILEMVRRFEQEHNAVVYHALRDEYEYFDKEETLLLFYVSQENEDWGEIKYDLSVGEAHVYKRFIDSNYLSEFSYLEFKNVNGAIIKTSDKVT